MFLVQLSNKSFPKNNFRNILGNKLTLNNRQINAKRGLNLVAKSWIKLTKISPLKLAFNLLMLIITEILYFFNV